MRSLSKVLMLASVLGGMDVYQSTPYRAPNRGKRRRDVPISDPVRAAEVLEERKKQFIMDLNEHNQKRYENGHWSEFEVVEGIMVWSYNMKNAIKSFNSLMRQNKLQITEQSS